jgi:Protein of unknown function (DUF3148)
MSKEFKVGDRVKLITLPRYVKTAEPMPMLRPPDVIQIGEEGVILDRRPGGFWGIRFSRGAFLLDSEYIETVEKPPASTPVNENMPETFTHPDRKSDEE